MAPSYRRNEFKSMAFQFSKFQSKLLAPQLRKLTSPTEASKLWTFESQSEAHLTP